MYVCLCRGITEKQIEKQIAAGVNSLSALQEVLGVGVDCGSCCEYLQQMLSAASVAEVSDGDAVPR